MGDITMTRQPFVSNDARNNPRLPAGFAERFRLRSLIFVPLVVREEVIGVLAYADLSARARPSATTRSGLSRHSPARPR